MFDSLTHKQEQMLLAFRLGVLTVIFAAAVPGPAQHGERNVRNGWKAVIYRWWRSAFSNSCHTLAPAYGLVSQSCPFRSMPQKMHRLCTLSLLHQL
jgi:hypothetical protein